MVTEHKSNNRSKYLRLILIIIGMCILAIASAFWILGGAGSGTWGTILSIAFPVVAVLFSLISWFLPEFRSPKRPIEQPGSQAASSQTYVVPLANANQQLPPVIEVQVAPLQTDSSSVYMNSSPSTSTGPLARNAYQGNDLRKDFFVSYSSDDRQWAEWIAWQLEDAHYTTVLPAWDFSPGTDINIMIDETLKEAKRMLLVLSPAYLDELKKRREVVKVLKRSFESTDDKVIPVCVKECKEQLLRMFGSITYVDLVGLSQSEARSTLLASLSKRRAKPETPPAFPGQI